MALLFLDLSKLYLLVCIRYIYLGGFPMYLHCIRLLCFLESFAHLYCICLLHFLERFADLFFSTQIMSTYVTFHGMVSLSISIVHVCYTF